MTTGWRMIGSPCRPQARQRLDMAGRVVQCRNVAQLAAAMGPVQTGVADGDFLQRLQAVGGEPLRDDVDIAQCRPLRRETAPETFGPLVVTAGFTLFAVVVSSGCPWARCSRPQPRSSHWPASRSPSDDSRDSCLLSQALSLHHPDVDIGGTLCIACGEADKGALPNNTCAAGLYSRAKSGWFCSGKCKKM